MWRTKTHLGIAATAILSLAIAACTGGSDGRPAFAATLETFDDCDELLDYFVGHAVEMVGPYGLEGPGGMARGPVPQAAEGEAMDTDAGGGAAAPEPAPAPVEGEDFSGTNVQESGVDEPDIVKTDGRRLVTLSGQQLHVLDVSGAEPSQTGSLRLPDEAGRELLLHGDRVLVLGTGGGHVGPMASPPPGHLGATSTVTLIDLEREPEVVETLAVDGAYVSARLVDGVARVALRTQPVGLDFVTPDGSGLRAEREATERNREIVEDSTIENWLPYSVREGSGETDAGLLLGCGDVHHPEDFGGLGLAAVFSLDPDAGLEPAGAAAVVGASETVYATPANLYVATQQWEDLTPGGDGARAPEDVTTALHRFSISDPRAPSYEASGEVPGWLLDQWALSEHDGHLRVATTEGPRWGPEEGPDASESAVRVLDADLEEVGAVDGLGVGERIYAVRYAGDIGYVVTFRQVDPLYTIDLADPTEPRVVGELKITGYSGYLHPIGDGRLLGVGQDASEEGQLRGAQVSIFDVADLSEPQRIDQLTIPDAHTPVEHDHRALLHWEAEDLIVLPIEQHHPPMPVEPDASEPEDPAPESPFSGALALRIDGGQLEEHGRVSHPGRGDQGPPIQRALVVGDVLYTVGHGGILASDLGTLEEIAWIGL